MGSHLLDAAETARVAAGGALAVDRDVFSAAVTEMVENHPNITVRREEVTALDESAPVLVASGPLTEGALAQAVAALTGDHRLSFYDAVAPIVTAESLDYDKVFAASRYGRGEADYLNCPFNKEEYEAFHAALIAAERAPLHDFDGDRPSTRAVCRLRSWLPAARIRSDSAPCAPSVCATRAPATAPGPPSSCVPRTRPARSITSSASRPT